MSEAHCAACQPGRVGNLLPTWIVALWLNAWAASCPPYETRDNRVNALRQFNAAAEYLVRLGHILNPVVQIAFPPTEQRQRRLAAQLPF